MTTKDMLQVLIKGQNELKEGLTALREETKGDLAVLREETKGDLAVLRKEMKGDLVVLREEMRDGFKKVHERLDKQGKQLAYLDDDAPTREEHDGLVKRVEKVEKVLSS